MLRYRVLGPVTVETPAGDRVAPGGRKQRLLLGALLLNAPRVASADALVDSLWPGALPDDPSAALQTQVSRLRSFLRTVDPDADIEREAYGYRLVGGRVETDAARFETLVEEARSAPSPEAAVATLDAALTLWEGRPYAEFAGREPFEGEAGRLEEAGARAQELRAEALLALGRFDEARAAGEALVTRDPLGEKPRALLMEALYRGGRQAEALEVYQAYRRLLSEELGLQPSPGIRQLELEILRHEKGAGTLQVRAEAPELDVRFLDGPTGRVAFATAGEGPPLLVPPGWVSSLQAIGSGADPRSPFYARLARRLRLVLYDRCGMGLSSGDAPFSLENDVAEAAAVLDAADVGRAAVLALSQAGPAAIALASRAPERVSALVLFGTYASGVRTFHRADVRRSMLGLVRASWGLGSKMLADLIVPDAPADVARGFARLQRQSATPERAAEALEQMFGTDVTDLLPGLRQPTLVIHYEDDPAVPFRAGRELADLIRGARLVRLGGRAHLPRPDDLHRLAEAIAEHVAGAAPVRHEPPAGPL